MKILLILNITFSLLFIPSTYANNADFEIPQVDTSFWVKIPLTFKTDPAQIEEKVEIAFPVEPTITLETGISATDTEGMIYSLASLELTDDFNLEDSILFLAEAIQASAGKELSGFAPLTPDETSYLIMWRENDHMIRLTAIMSPHFLYLLQTSTPYSTDFDTVLWDSAKTAAFTQLFNVGES